LAIQLAGARVRWPSVARDALAAVFVTAGVLGQHHGVLDLLDLFVGFVEGAAELVGHAVHVDPIFVELLFDAFLQTSDFAEYLFLSVFELDLKLFLGFLDVVFEGEFEFFGLGVNHLLDRGFLELLVAYVDLHLTHFHVELVEVECFGGVVFEQVFLPLGFSPLLLLHIEHHLL